MAQLPFLLPPLHNTAHLVHPTPLRQIRKTSTPHHLSLIQPESCSCWPKGSSPAGNTLTPSSFTCSGLRQLHIKCTKVTNCFIILEKNFRNFSRYISKNLNLQNPTKQRNGSSNVLGKVFWILTWKGFLQVKKKKKSYKIKHFASNRKKEIARVKWKRNN